MAEETSRERLLVRELQQVGQVCDELRRSSRTWQDEYLRILAFSGNSESAKKNMRATLEKVFQLLDMQLQQNPQIAEAMEAIEAVLSLVKRFEMNSVDPVPLLNPAASEATFNFYLDLEVGISAFKIDGRYEDPAIQARCDGWTAGARFGFAEAVREMKKQQVETTETQS
jgi:hypothetical protein